jgi:hypothetical protein
MIVSAVKALLTAGITTDSIRVPRLGAPDDIDLVFAFEGDAVLVELKEDDFSPKDAVNLATRVRDGEGRAVVVTYGAVTPDAKTVLERLFPATSGTGLFLLARAPADDSDRITYLEGANCISDLERYVDRARISSVMRGLRVSGSGAALNLRQVVMHHLLKHALTEQEPRRQPISVPPQETTGAL